MKIPVVTIQTPNGPVEINETDYNPAIHVLAVTEKKEEAKKPKEPKEPKKVK